MISDLKLGFKMMKYGHSAKLSFVASILMVVFGLLLSAVGIMTDNSFFGGYFIMLAALFLMQLLATVNAANLVQVSPAKKKLQTRIPALFSAALMLAGYLFSVIIAGVVVCTRSEYAGNVNNYMITTAIIMAVIMMYYGACYKYFVVSTVLFFVVFLTSAPLINGDLQFVFTPFSDSRANFGLAALIGMAVILLGGLLQYLISLALYKAPISRWALGATLRKQM